MPLVVASEADTRCTTEECQEVGGNFEAWDDGSCCTWDSRAYISRAFHQTSLSDMLRNRSGHSRVVWVRKVGCIESESKMEAYMYGEYIKFAHITQENASSSFASSCTKQFREQEER